MGGRYTDNGVSSWKLHSRSVLHIGVTFLRCSLLFVCPDANYYVPTGRAICIFSFRAYLYASFSCGFVFLSQIATNIAYCIAHSSRIIVLFVTWSFWWNFCKSCAFGFSIFCSVSFQLLLLHLFSICLSFFQSKLVFVKIDKVLRCLKYSASLMSTQSVLRRNSDNSDYNVKRVIATCFSSLSVRKSPK